MANVQLNIFNNFNLFQGVATSPIGSLANLRIHHVYIPGSISFNNVAIGISGTGTTAKTASISFGLYSLNGSTLSLANSASVSTNPSENTFAWVTLNTSATQNITPGDWFFAYKGSTSSQDSIRIVRWGGPFNVISNAGYGGPFFRGNHTSNFTNMPNSIATSDLVLEGNNALAEQVFPYILISA